MNEVGVCTAVEFTAPDRLSARAETIGIFALYHEILDNAVESKTVIVAFLSKLDKVFNALVSVFGKQLDLYLAVILDIHNDDRLAFFGSGEVCNIDIFLFIGRR